MNKDKFETVGSFGLYLWLALIAASLFLFFFMPELFEPESIRQFFSDNLVNGLLAYFIIWFVYSQ